MEHQQLESLRLLRQLRIASLLEGSTLIILVGIAVPLKYLGGISTAVSLMGPIHGVAFLIYVWLAIQVVLAEIWPTRSITVLFLSALIPFGGLVTASLIRQQEYLIQGPRSSPQSAEQS